MQTVPIKSFRQLHRGLEEFRSCSTMFFRGQSDADWPLVPKAGREEFRHIEDDYLFADWKSAVRSHDGIQARTELELLALAQHHGLATRLLDWTANPLIAAFFAVWEHRDCDAAIFAYDACECLPADFPERPFRVGSEGNVIGWKPDPFTPRIQRQCGLFTIHYPPTAPHYALRRLERMVRFVVDRRYREQLREELAYYGFTRGTLFPDLEGASAHLNWSIHRVFPRDTNGADKKIKQRGASRSAMKKRRTSLATGSVADL
jgi:hypothetical protein